MFHIPFSRSISKSTLFDYCKRKYYFQYYTSHLKHEAPDRRLETLLVKNLQSIDMWIGSKIHQLLSDYLHLYLNNNADTKHIDQIVQNILEETEYEFLLSQRKDYAHYDKYQKFGLSEHYFKQKIDITVAHERIQQQFQNFLESDEHNKIVTYFQTATCFVEPRDPDFDLMKFEVTNNDALAGVIIFAQPDFGVKVDKKKYIIYDWKSGKVPKKDLKEISDQLRVYAYKIRYKLGYIQNLDIQVKEVFFDQMKIFGGEVNEQMLYDTQDMITKKVAKQKVFLQDEDIAKNIPKPLKYFPKCNEPAKCDRCRFRNICAGTKE